MTTVYQVWVLADDLEYANEHQQDLADTKMLESEDRGVAMWFAFNYPFAYVENSVIRVEQVEVEDNGDEYCKDILAEIPLVE